MATVYGFIKPAGLWLFKFWSPHRYQFFNDLVEKHNIHGFQLLFWIYDAWKASREADRFSRRDLWLALSMHSEDFRTLLAAETESDLAKELLQCRYLNDHWHDDEAPGELKAIFDKYELGGNSAF